MRDRGSCEDLVTQLSAETSRNTRTAEPHQEEDGVQPEMASRAHRGLPTLTLGPSSVLAGWGLSLQGCTREQRGPLASSIPSLHALLVLGVP